MNLVHHRLSGDTRLRRELGHRARYMPSLSRLYYRDLSNPYSTVSPLGFLKE